MRFATSVILAYLAITAAAVPTPIADNGKYISSRSNSTTYRGSLPTNIYSQDVNQVDHSNNRYDGDDTHSIDKRAGPVKFDYFKTYDSDENLEKRAGPVKFDYFKTYDGSGDNNDINVEKRLPSIKFDHLYKGGDNLEKRAGPVKFEYFKTYDGSGDNEDENLEKRLQPAKVRDNSNYDAVIGGSA